MRKINPRAIEKKWQKKWKEEKQFSVNLKNCSKKYYNLVMFPYPSGAKLHIGHWYNYGPADSWGRYMKLRGFNVFEPIGYDSFGLPAENYAIKTGVHPKKTTGKNIESMRKQLRVIGAMYDWDKEINTSSSDYYKWTQWIFLQLFKKGLAYKKKSPVNWCPGCQTVLANEQVQENQCERCGSQIIQKDLEQWFFKISDYREKLLNFTGLDWPEKTISMQKNWIGRKEGINITYPVHGTGLKITVFTTRPDTNFGATFLVLAPDCDFVKNNILKFPKKENCENYVERTLHKTELERIAEGRKKTGEFTGLYAVNHLTGKKMPVYLSDFVLSTVGTGAVVGVPGHDLRDFEFAKAKGLEVIRVVVGPDGDKSPIVKPEQVQEESGYMINSGFLNGLDINKATEKIMEYMEKKGWGKRVVTYRLRDWLISRQRYWGAPIPIVYCDKCGTVPIPEKDLPVKLPLDVDFKPKGDGKSPLNTSKSFINTKCPKCNGKARREFDTMDTFVCSSWYFLRYPSAHLKTKAFDKEMVNKWLPVDMYIGGPEHACMHLLYARFLHKVLHDLGYFKPSEPFKRLVHQGMITKDGAKMSKSKGNVVAPDSFVEQFGSDVFRMYLMFMGPYTDGGDWNDKGISGIARFYEKFYKLAAEKENAKISSSPAISLLHKTIKKVTGDIELFHFNTAISAFMSFVNDVQKEDIDLKTKREIVILISPFAPHLAEELWSLLGGRKSVFTEKWPKYKEELTVDNTIEFVCMINGKVRAKFNAPKNISKEDAIKTAKEQPNIEKNIKDKEMVKEIFVPDKLVNIVIR